MAIYKGIVKCLQFNNIKRSINQFKVVCISYVIAVWLEIIKLTLGLTGIYWWTKTLFIANMFSWNQRQGATHTISDAKGEVSHKPMSL